MLRGIHYRIRGAIPPDQQPASGAFTVSLGELRAARCEPPDPKTDHYQIEIAYAGEVGVVSGEKANFGHRADATQSQPAT